MSRTTKSATEFAREALDTAQALPAYSGPFSPPRSPSRSSWRCSPCGSFSKLDYRGVVAGLAKWKELRDPVGIDRVPHHTTLVHAERRLLKDGRRTGPDRGGRGVDDKSRSVAGDSTGLEAGHVSVYFSRRSGRQQRQFPKRWAAPE